MKGIRIVQSKNEPMHRVTIQVHGVSHALGSYRSAYVARSCRAAAERIVALNEKLTVSVIQDIKKTHSHMDSDKKPANRILHSQNGVVRIDVSTPTHQGCTALIDYGTFVEIAKHGRMTMGNLRAGTVLVAGRSVAGLILGVRGNRVEFRNGTRTDLREKNLIDSGVCVTH